MAAAAAFLEWAVLLTADPSRQAERALAAARASLQAGAFDAARGLLATAEAGELDEFQRAQGDLLRGQILFSSGVGSDAATLLLNAAKRLEALDPDLARETYLDALGAAQLAGPAGASARTKVCRAVRALPPAAHPPRPIDLLLDGLALLVTEGRAAAAPTLRRAARVFIDEGMSSEERLRWGWLASAPTYALWDNEATRTVLVRQIQLVRDAGALEQLPIYLTALATATVRTGDFAAAAAMRCGQARLARYAFERLAATTQPAGTDWGLGIEARSHALLSEGAAAEELYREAVDRLGRARLRPELARAQLLYGEWLRREYRRADARTQLQNAHEMLDAMGMAAFAERARRELIATGGTVRKRSFETRNQLTPQEEQIARLACDGRTNSEIGAQLFLSARTVEWHPRKVFTKLGIGSRRELHTALPLLGRDGRPV